MSKNSILNDIKNKLKHVFVSVKEVNFNDAVDEKKRSDASSSNKKINDDTSNKKTIKLEKRGPNNNWRSRELREFNKIVINAPIVVNVHKGLEENAKLSGDEDFLEKLKTNISNKTLYISMTGSASAFREQTLTVWTEKLDYVQLSGASELNYMDAHEDFMKLDIQGASTAKIEGSVNLLEVITSGASTLKAGNLIVNQLDANSSGASTIKVHVKKIVKLKASGASSCTVYGNPSVKNVLTSGVASIKYK